MKLLRSFHLTSQTHSSINTTPTNQSSVIVHFLDLVFPISISAQKNCLPLSRTTDAISGRLFEAQRTYDLYVWSLHKDSLFVQASVVTFPSGSFLSLFLLLSPLSLFFLLSILLARYVCDQSWPVFTLDIQRQGKYRGISGSKERLVEKSIMAEKSFKSREE